MITKRQSRLFYISLSIDFAIINVLFVLFLTDPQKFELIKILGRVLIFTGSLTMILGLFFLGKIAYSEIVHKKRYDAKDSKEDQLEVQGIRLSNKGVIPLTSIKTESHPPINIKGGADKPQSEGYNSQGFIHDPNSSIGKEKAKSLDEQDQERKQ